MPLGTQASTITNGDTAPQLNQQYPRPYHIPGEGAETQSSEDKPTQLRSWKKLKTEPCVLAAPSVGQTHHCAPREGVGGHAVLTPSPPPPPLCAREPLGIVPPLPHTPRRPGKPQSVPDPPQTSLSFLSPLSCALGKHISGIPKSRHPTPALSVGLNCQMLERKRTLIIIVNY